MTTKLWVAAVLALGLASSGAAALQLTRAASCCYEGSPCCFEGSPCCEADGGDCCYEGSPCCFPGSPCCEAEKAVSVKAIAETPDCCFPGSPCCEGGACCVKK